MVNAMCLPSPEVWAGASLQDKLWAKRAIEAGKSLSYNLLLNRQQETDGYLAHLLEYSPMEALHYIIN